MLLFLSIHVLLQSGDKNQHYGLYVRMVCGGLLNARTLYKSRYNCANTIYYGENILKEPLQLCKHDLLWGEHSERAATTVESQFIMERTF